MYGQLDRSSKLPLHVQVEELIRKLVTSAGLNNAFLLPKEKELAESLGISRSTVRPAANKLENEGLLKRKNGVGTRVTTKRSATALEQWYSFTQEKKEKGIDVNDLFIRISFVAATAKLGEFFNIETGRPVLKLSKLKGAGNKPIVYF